MASLTSPVRRLTLPEITAGYLGELGQGGGSLVVCDEEQAFLGVLPAAALSLPTPAQLIRKRAIARLERFGEAPADVRPPGQS